MGAMPSKPPPAPGAEILCLVRDGSDRKKLREAAGLPGAVPTPRDRGDARCQQHRSPREPTARCACGRASGRESRRRSGRACSSPRTSLPGRLRRHHFPRACHGGAGPLPSGRAHDRARTEAPAGTGHGLASGRDEGTQGCRGGEHGGRPGDGAQPTGAPRGARHHEATPTTRPRPLVATPICGHAHCRPPIHPRHRPTAGHAPFSPAHSHHASKATPTPLATPTHGHAHLPALYKARRGALPALGALPSPCTHLRCWQRGSGGCPGVSPRSRWWSLGAGWGLNCSQGPRCWGGRGLRCPEALWGLEVLWGPAGLWRARLV